MSLTFSQTQGDGVTVSYPILAVAGYFEDKDIVVELINTATGLVTVQGQGTQYIVNAGNVIFTSAPTIDYYVRIRRLVSNNDTYSNFNRGTAFGADNLDKSFKQALYQLQQIADGFREDDFYWKGNTNAGERRLVNLADGVASNDAATRRQLKASTNMMDLYNTPWAGR